MKLELACPPVWESPMKARCKGKAKLKGAREKERYNLRHGKERKFAFRLRERVLRRLERRGEAELTARLRNRDAASGTESVLEFVIERR